MKRRPLFSLAIFLTGALLLNACGSEPTPAPATTPVAVTTVPTTAVPTPAAVTPSVGATPAAATTAASTTAPAATVTTTAPVSATLAVKYSTPVLDSGHSSYVYAVALSPDGKIVATGSDDTSVKLWDVATKKLLYTIKDYGHSIKTLAFSPDGKRLAAAGYNPSVKIWDVASGKTLQTFELKNGYSFAQVTFSADGKLLAGSNDDTNVYIWDTVSGSLKSKVKGQDDQLGVAFSPDGKMLAAGDKTGQVNVWDLGSPDKPLATFKTRFYAYALKFSSDSKTVFGGDSLWDISSGKALATFTNPVLGVSADGTQVAVYNASKKQFEILNPQTGQQLSAFSGPSDPEATRLYFSPDFKTLVTTNYSEAAVLYDMSKGQKLESLGSANAGATIVAISPDSTLIAHTTVENYKANIEILNAADGKVLNTFKVKVNGIKQMAFSADSKLLAAGGAIWEARTGKQVANLVADELNYTGGRFEIFSPDGKTVAMSGDHGPVSLWDSQGQQKATIKPAVDDVESLAFSPDSKSLAISTKDDIEIYDLSAATPALLKRYGIDLAYSVAFSPDQKSILVGSFDGPVFQFERTNLNNYQDFKGQHRVNRVAYSSDGKRVLGIGDGYAIVWDTKSRQELTRTDLNDSYNVTDMAVSSDDKLLVTAHSDGSVKVMQLPPAGASPVATSTAAATPSATAAPSPTPVPAVQASLALKTATAPSAGHTGTIEEVQLSPDGKIVASASQDTSIRLWDLTGKKLLTVLKGNFTTPHTMQFSQDNKTLALYSADFSARGGSATLWDVATGQLIKSLQLPAEYQVTVRFTPDIKLIAVANRDKVEVYEMSTGQKVNEFAFPYSAADLAFSPDGKTLYAAGGNNETRQYVGLFNMQTGETISLTPLVAGEILKIAVSSDQKVVAATTKAGPVVMVDGLTGKQLGSYTQPDKFAALALGFDAGNQLRVVYIDKNKNYQVYGVAIGEGKALGKVEFKGGDKVYQIGFTFNPDSAVLAFGDTNGTLTIAGYNDGAVVASFPGVIGDYPASSAYNPQNQTWLVINRNGVVQVWDAAMSKVLATLGQRNQELETDQFLAVSPNGKLLATGGEFSKAITLWDLATNQKLATLSGSGPSQALRFSDDSSQLLAVVNQTAFYSWEASENFATAHRQASLSDADKYNAAKFSPDGTRLGYITGSKTLTVLDLKTNKPSTIPGKFYEFTFLPNSQNLAASLDSGEVQILDLGGKTLKTLDKSYTGFLRATFSPDGKIAAGRNSGAIVLWDTATFGKIFTTGNVQALSLTIAFSPDGKSLLSGNADGSATLWEVK